MNLQVSATFQPDDDEVWVDFRSTEDDLVTITVADQVRAILYSQTSNPLGKPFKSKLAEVTTDSDYLQPEQNFVLKFRHPQRKMDLVLDVEATFGANVFTKSLSVGEGVSAQTDMALPDNPTWELDLVAHGDPVQGPNAPVNPNAVVLAPEIRQYITTYDFTAPQAPENYAPLAYTGGGTLNRLFLSNRTNAYYLQAAGEAPWINSAFAFMELAGINLLPNSFFNNVTANVPNGYVIDSAGAILTQSVDADFQTAVGAKIWKLRFRQQNSFSAFNQAAINPVSHVAVTAGLNYCLSAYARVRSMTVGSSASRLTLAFRWYDGTTFLSEDKVDLQTSNYAALALAAGVATAPVSATFCQPVIRIGSLDPGDDIELSLFAPQLEVGTFPTSRTQGSRLADTITIPDYNATNQKIRFELIPGFDSGVNDVFLTAGPLAITFTGTGALKAEVNGINVAVTYSFAAGDVLDFTVEHLAGGMVKLYSKGELLGQIALPVFTAAPAPLLIQGVGIELLRLTVFSRS